MLPHSACHTNTPSDKLLVRTPLTGYGIAGIQLLLHLCMQLLEFSDVVLLGVLQRRCSCCVSLLLCSQQACQVGLTGLTVLELEVYLSSLVL